MYMKRSHWLFNCSTPDDRYYMIWVLSKRNFRLVREGEPSHYRIVANISKRIILLSRVEQVLQRERELQCAHMCAFDPTRVNPEQVTHLDCNVLRIWPDKGIEELIKFYTYKAEIMRGFAAARWSTGERHGAHQFKLARRGYEQALIKLKRERDRRKRVYNLS